MATVDFRATVKIKGKVVKKKMRFANVAADFTAEQASQHWLHYNPKHEIQQIERVGLVQPAKMKDLITKDLPIVEEEGKSLTESLNPSETDESQPQ